MTEHEKIIPTNQNGWYEKEWTALDESLPQSQRAMVIMAHPDDESEFTGGMIARLVEKGFRVSIVHLTDGRFGGRAGENTKDVVETRLAESVEAAKVLGAARLINLGATDGALPQDPALAAPLIQQLVTIMRQERGSLYITHPTPLNPETVDYHSDHRNTAGIVERAIQEARNGNFHPELGEPLSDMPTLLFADTQGSKNAISRRVNPFRRSATIQPSTVDFLLDITPVAWKKGIAFASHKSQVGNTPEGMQMDYVTQRAQLDRFRAKQASFVPYRLRRNKTVFAEGYTIHTAHGFNTYIGDIFDKKEVHLPRRLFPKRRLPLLV